MLHNSKTNNLSKISGIVALLTAIFLFAVGLLPASAATYKPPQTEENCYLLGKTTFDLIAHTIYVSVDIKSKNLKGITSEIDNNRLGEQLSSDNADKDITAMHGPQAVAAMYGHASQIFAAPLVITSQSQSDYPNSHDNQYAESYLDEAESIVPNDHGVLTAWVKLSQGQGGEWAYHLGQLQSSIEALKLKHCTPAVLVLAGNLAKAVPQGTPKDLVLALYAVADQYKSGHYTQQTLDNLETAIGDAYGY
jgi:hypothetical protein